MDEMPDWMGWFIAGTSILIVISVISFAIYSSLSCMGLDDTEMVIAAIFTGLLLGWCAAYHYETMQMFKY